MQWLIHFSLSLLTFSVSIAISHDVHVIYLSLIHKGNYPQFMEVKDPITKEKSFKVCVLYHTVCLYVHVHLQI